jgi:murein DD-endopeptidase MepM/ murein hydrolase activator NlpD
VLSSFEPVEPLVAIGDRVARGDVIGILLPGHCATPCLHLGARIDGEYVNPLLFLGGLEHAVLYPLG